MGSNEKMVECFKDTMTKEFEMIVLRLMKYFLGLENRQGKFRILCHKKHMQRTF